MASQILLLGLLVVASCSLTFASDPSTVQDFCVADFKSPALVNGLACKDPKLVQVEDFFYSGLHVAGNTSNSFGSAVTPVTVGQLPGLNTLGLSIVRIDYAPGGISPPHTHLRATELLTVLKGTLNVGFITATAENRLITKVLQKGDVFVFPVGLIHFQHNVGTENAIAIAALSSQNPGTNVIANTVFGANPSLSNDVLTKAFQVDKRIIKYIKSKF